MKLILSAFLILILSACSAISQHGNTPLKIEYGVSKTLMQHRARVLNDVQYTINVHIPDQYNSPITAETTLWFNLKDTAQDLQIDFSNDRKFLQDIMINGVGHTIRHKNQHIIIPKELMRVGKNTIVIKHQVGELAINRSVDFLYTLFVPDRARSAFPIFDQPNLKAVYNLTLTLPKSWTAIANASEQSSITEGQYRTVTYKPTKPISSYLFSFAAGKFQEVNRTIKGVKMTALHRETDVEKVARNMDAIFTLHADALRWLEDYTDIPHPYPKLDFIILPGFPFGGMEHPGAIQYKDASLFLDASASKTSQLSRARLISHEVAHMWFGNLVTMDWFNDVWTKEVFANFMAAKIINPSFPNVDHDLNFLLSHYPAAYNVDRTIGANAIRQDLPNLNEAGSLYGAIIYRKAPIMMRQLELALGQETFRRGIQTYLKRYARGNATWPQLIEILDSLTPMDLRTWSHVWVNTAGRPHFKINENNNSLSQLDPAKKNRHWGQQFNVDNKRIFSADKPASIHHNSFINSDGLGYGLFPAIKPDEIIKHWKQYSDVQKGVLIINAYENMLENNPLVSPKGLFDLTVHILEIEDNSLLLNQTRNILKEIFWNYVPENKRLSVAEKLEAMLAAKITDTDKNYSSAHRKADLKLYQSIVLSGDGLDYLADLMMGKASIPQINLSENDRIALASTLAIKRPEMAHEFINYAYSQITNDDRKRRFTFLKASLSSDTKVRDQFFISLKSYENRYVENWVLSGLANLHHPLRRKQAAKHITPTLELMEEIYLTGSIFFPKRFIDTTLSNHNSKHVQSQIKSFFRDRPDYNRQLKGKILQSADLLFRKVEILQDKDNWDD